jgi:hypothetical protein
MTKDWRDGSDGAFMTMNRGRAMLHVALYMCARALSFRFLCIAAAGRVPG